MTVRVVFEMARGSYHFIDERKGPAREGLLRIHPNLRLQLGRHFPMTGTCG